MTIKNVLAHFYSVKSDIDFILLHEKNQTELWAEMGCGTIETLNGKPVIFTNRISQDFVHLVKIVDRKTEKIDLLLQEYFEKSNELQLAYDGQHPVFKEALKIEKNFPTLWNEYVSFCNLRNQELRELAKQINELKGGADAHQ